MFFFFFENSVGVIKHLHKMKPVTSFSLNESKFEIYFFEKRSFSCADRIDPWCWNRAINLCTRFKREIHRVWISGKKHQVMKQAEWFSRSNRFRVARLFQIFLANPTLRTDRILTIVYFFLFYFKNLPRRDYQLNSIRLIRCATCSLRDFFLKDSSTTNDTSTNPSDGK